MTAPRATKMPTEDDTRTSGTTSRKPPTWDQIRENIPAPGTGEGAYFHYTPAEAAEWLPFGPHKLRKMAFAREIPFVDNGNRVWFSGMNIRAISQQFTVQPFAKSAA
ncbi:hypothetical protein [Streptomyces europaeiscabiei]|uniref:hypothetical protein n=1 Tax=Streptomyces europaeiscabiei TaxID=146819 RepID=UPI0029A4E601|nr:hypothetical protein [Streptomyces europaeiscabiei]MDX3839813.1 hypothetical protein [Streptomyces europaeiscabiei]